MNFEQLSYFITIVDNGTYFEAAESLHISQSSLSKQIIKLEKELDIQLFDREYRSATLTEAGQKFYNEAVILDRQYKIMLNNIKEYKKLQGHEIHIGTLPFQSQYNISSRIAAFQKSNEDVSLSVDEVEETELFRGINYNRYDVIIARENMLDADTYDLYPFEEDELVAAVSKSSSLANLSSINLSVLSEHNLVLMNKYTSIYSLCTELLNKYCSSYKIGGTGRIESILGAVSADQGISLLPRGNFKIFNHDNIKLLSLEPKISLSIVIAVKKAKAKAPAIKRFINFFSTKQI